MLTRGDFLKRLAAAVGLTALTGKAVQAEKQPVLDESIPDEIRLPLRGDIRMELRVMDGTGALLFTVPMTPSPMIVVQGDTIQISAPPTTIYCE